MYEPPRAFGATRQSLKSTSSLRSPSSKHKGISHGVVSLPPPSFFPSYWEEAKTLPTQKPILSGCDAAMGVQILRHGRCLHFHESADRTLRSRRSSQQGLELHRKAGAQQLWLSPGSLGRVDQSEVKSRLGCAPLPGSSGLVTLLANLEKGTLCVLL